MNFPIRQIIGNVEHSVGNYFKNGWNGQAGQNMDATTIQHLKNNATAGDRAMMQAAGKKLKSYKKGGIVHKTGPALLHKGEYVVPRDQVEQQHKTWMMSDGGAMKR